MGVTSSVTKKVSSEVRKILIKLERTRRGLGGGKDREKSDVREMRECKEGGKAYICDSTYQYPGSEVER